MDNECYITPNIIVKNNKFYYLNDITKRLNIINNKNWHKFLSEDGWEKIDWGWKVRLSKYSESKFSNCPYAIKDCGAEGNCLFECISTALNYYKALDINNNDIVKSDKLKQEYYTAQDIRLIASNQINEDNFTTIIEIYRIAKDNNEFYGDWDPYKTNTVELLQKEINTLGNNFWGDHIILGLLEQGLNISFILFNSENLDINGDRIKGLDLSQRYTIHNCMNEIRSKPKVILLYYINNIHFQIIGYLKSNIMHLVFNTEDLPNEIFYIHKIDCKN